MDGYYVYGNWTLLFIVLLSHNLYFIQFIFIILYLKKKKVLKQENLIEYFS